MGFRVERRYYQSLWFVLVSIFADLITTVDVFQGQREEAEQAAAGRAPDPTAAAT